MLTGLAQDFSHSGKTGHVEQTLTTVALILTSSTSPKLSAEVLVEVAMMLPTETLVKMTRLIAVVWSLEEWLVALPLLSRMKSPALGTLSRLMLDQNWS